MQAVVELAFAFEGIELGEVVPQFLGCMSTTPKPLMPGVSMILTLRKVEHFGIGGGVLSLLVLGEISAVRKLSFGANALSKVDFPTPLWPENMDTFPRISPSILATSFSSKHEIS